MEDHNWLIEVSEKIKKKMRKVVIRNQNWIPYRTVNGRYEDMTEKDIYWWTNGFWGGILWQLYHATGEELYLTEAVRVEEKMEKNLHAYRGMDHDSGFKWLLTAVADMAMKTFIREDGSAHHIVVFDPATGKVLGPLGGQGYGEGSS